MVVSAGIGRKLSEAGDEKYAQAQAKLVGELAAQMLAATETTAVRNRPS